MVPISSHPCQHLPFSVFLLFSIFSCLIFIIYFFPVALGLACSFSSSLSCPSLFSALIHYPMQSRTQYKSPSNAIHWRKPLLLQCSRTVVTAVVFNILISSKNSKINPVGRGFGGTASQDPTPPALFCPARSELSGLQTVTPVRLGRWETRRLAAETADQPHGAKRPQQSDHALTRAVAPCLEHHTESWSQDRDVRGGKSDKASGGREQSVCYEKFLQWNSISLLRDYRRFLQKRKKMIRRGMPFF